MSKKFTEEQYRKIVEIGEQFDEDRAKKSSEVIDYVFDEYPDAYNYTEILVKGLAIANPLTREWAHDKFVEKEKKYYWNSIKTDSADNHLRLFRHENGVISTYSRFEPANNINKDEQLTESEIREWGFNPDMFDREEV